MTPAAPDMVNLESTSLASAAYDRSCQQLRLDFRDGSCYAYLNVPPQIFHALRMAPSKGSFFNRSIRGRYRHLRIAG